MGTVQGSARGDEDMSGKVDLKAKLDLDVFKPVAVPHIKIRPGMEKDARLKPAVRVCPAGLYSENENGEVALATIDGYWEAAHALTR